MKYFAALLLLLLVHTVCAVDIASGAASVFGDATSAIGGAASTAASGVSRGGAAVQSGVCKGVSCQSPTAKPTNPNQSYNGAMGTLHTYGESAPGASSQNPSGGGRSSTSSRDNGAVSPRLSSLLMTISVMLAIMTASL